MLQQLYELYIRDTPSPLEQMPPSGVTITTVSPDTVHFESKEVVDGFINTKPDTDPTAN